MMIPIYKSKEQQDSLYRYYHVDGLGIDNVGGASKTSERKTLTPHMMLSGDD